jgi:hypothetical protein
MPAFPVSFSVGWPEVFQFRVRYSRTECSLPPFLQGDGLLNPLTATLDQDDQHNYRQDSGNDPNNCYIVHVYSPFFLFTEVLIKTFHYYNGRWPQSHQEEGGKDKQDERKDKFDRCLCCLLLHLLAALGSQRV